MACSTPKNQTQLIPRDIIFGNPVRTAPHISPDGTRMAYLAPVEGVLNVWVRTIGSDDDRPVTRDKGRGIQNYFWSQDNKQIMYLQDVDGNENWRLYGVNLESAEIRDFTPFDSVQVQIIEHNKNYPNEMLIAMNKENPTAHDIYHLDLITGESRLVAKNPGNFLGWVSDVNLKIRGSLAATPEGGCDLMIRKDENSAWQKIISWNAEDALTSGPIGFTGDGNSLYLIDSRNANSARLVKTDLATGKARVIAEDPKYDVSGAVVHPDSREVQAVSFTRERTEWFVLDESIRTDFESIAKLQHGDFSINDRDNADDTWIVGFESDDGPISFYAFDRNTRQGAFLFDNRPALREYKLANMEPISFKASDGMTIHGYITFPPDIAAEERKNLPLVLNVHGGPWFRDTWGYNPETQWLANRGYVCLQVNFRGSTGYGKDYINAANREWGGKMHQDLIDAVNWAVGQGYADPRKVAIYGGSYGGYAALIGATFTPDIFACAVDVVGPSNLMTWITTIPPYWSSMKDIFYKRIGNPDTEPDFLMSRSPITRVDQIKIPMLIAQGANDPRVKQAESEQIVAAMKEKGTDYEYLLFHDEGHGFVKPENRLKFYAAAEKFLAKHLGGRFEEEKTPPIS
ncbi:MAG: peptidase S9 [candidate division Zixibacteria bacterium RBG_16_53_22]|nr:MAG: peptidase S9 [candidate division Zixibacteria bacterium RBG_16_53_22]